MNSVEVHIPDSMNKQRFDYFFKYYEIVKAVICTESNEYIGEPINKVCRFCFKDETQTTFNTEAHLIPQLMGNRNYLTNIECDSCNNFFSNYENSLASFLLIERYFNQFDNTKNLEHREKDISKKISSILKKDKLGTIKLEDSIENPILEKIDDNFTQITFTKPTYTPLHVLKLFLKMGITLIDEFEINQVKKTIEFIMNRIQQIEILENYLSVYHYVIPGVNVYERPQLILFRKKNVFIDEQIPFYTIVIRYGISNYQLFIPLVQQDESLNKEKKLHFPIYPLIGVTNDYLKENGEYIFRVRNLSKNQKVKDEKSKILFEKRFYENGNHYLIIRNILQ